LTATSLQSTKVNLSEPSTFREASSVPHSSAMILYSTRS